jgi:hypothetical protein
MSAAGFFAASYAEARAKFLDASAGAGLTPTAYRCPAPGPEGEELFTDVVRAGSVDAEATIVATSSTHGVEGFCGSGAMTGLLRDGHLGNLPAGLAVVLVHAINPHGFAHLRRVNEDNVDLNRNFVDHGAGHPANAAYDAIHNLVVPSDWDGPARAAADAAIATYVAKHGAAAFQAVVSLGQYDHLDGVFYGGRAPTWSNRTFREIIARELANTRRIGFIDFHTGLGPRGYGELQFEGAPDSAEYLRAQQWYDGEVASAIAGEASSPVVSGHIGLAMYEGAPDAEVTVMGLEYGTIHFDRVLEAVRADNWLYIHGAVDSALGREIKAAIRDAFYGDDDAWKGDVYDRAVEIYRKTAAGLTQG